MKLTLFGEAARLLRMRLGISMKSMADAMDISSSYLSGIEYGEKRLAQKHIDSALIFFTNLLNDEKVTNLTQEDIESLRQAAEQSKEIVNTTSLTPDARGLVAAFARRLEEGDNPTPELVNWIKNKGDKN